MARTLKIFISSPGDVIPERELARKIIGELNEEMMGKVFLVPVLWEKEPLLASGTFQAQIESVEDTQILLGILWSRIGSPLPDSILRSDGSRYDSGTAFEFENALASHQKKGKPDILLYRKLGAPSMSLENPEAIQERLDQIRLLDSYIKKQLMAEDGSYLAAFHTFETEEKFEEILRTHLRKLILKQLEEQEEPETMTSEVPPETLALPDTLSVAVLPFNNMSQDPEQEFFVDGLTEDIITELSKFKDLDVIARNSTFQYKGQSVDIREVGLQLGTRYILEGSVRKAGNALRITGQLLDATDGSHVWGATYNHDLSETTVFDVQDELSRGISSVIGDVFGILGQVRFGEIKHKNLDNLDSDQSIEFVNSSFLMISEKLHGEALGVIEQAVERDPDNGDVQALLAHVYVNGFSMGFNSSPAILENAVAAGQRCVELEPNSDRTRAALGRAYFYSGKVRAALSEGERALKINPNHPIRLVQHGYILALSGDWDEGVTLCTKGLGSMEILPAQYFYILFFDHFKNERFNEALKFLDKFGPPRLWFTHACFAAVHGKTGNMKEAESVLNELKTLLPDFEDDVLGLIERCVGAPETTKLLLDGLQDAGVLISS